MLSKVIIFLCIFYSGHSQELACYQCIPSNSTGRCESPDKHDINTTICTETVETTDPDEMEMSKAINEMSLNSKEPSFCYYLYLDAGDSLQDEEINFKYYVVGIPEQTGYYRGCSQMSEGILQFCTALRTKIGKREINGRMINCKTCNSTRCNVGNFDVINTTVRSPIGKSLIQGIKSTPGSSAVALAFSRLIAVVIMIILSTLYF